MNNLAPMKNCPGVQGNLNWMSFTWGDIYESVKFAVQQICARYIVFT